MINLFNPKQTSLVAVISYYDHVERKNVEVKIYEQFWGSAYLPNIGQILVYLTSHGHKHITNPVCSRVM